MKTPFALRIAIRLCAWPRWGASKDRRTSFAFEERMSVKFADGFNNILMPITMNAEMVMLDLPKDNTD